MEKKIKQEIQILGAIAILRSQILSVQGSELPKDEKLKQIDKIVKEIKALDAELSKRLSKK